VAWALSYLVCIRADAWPYPAFHEALSTSFGSWLSSKFPVPGNPGRGEKALTSDVEAVHLSCANITVRSSLCGDHDGYSLCYEYREAVIDLYVNLLFFTPRSLTKNRVPRDLLLPWQRATLPKRIAADCSNFCNSQGSETRNTRQGSTFR
jgi:hypothetical protein